VTAPATRSEILNGERVAARLRETPIDAVKEVARRACGSGALDQAGSRVVADVLNALDHRP
jgi:hypothetical protein